MAKTYKKEPHPPKYEIAFDGVEYSQSDRDFLWHQLVDTLIKLKESNTAV